MATKPIREGFHTVTPYLIAQDVDMLLTFIKQAFGATEVSRTTGSAGGTHAEVKVGDSIVMVGGGASSGPMPAMVYLYMNNVDAVYEAALQAGATSIMEPADQSDGERRAGVKDASGNHWYIGEPLQ